MTTLKDSAQQVQNWFLKNGFQAQVIELPDSTRTAQEAAAAVGCDVAQIAKSIIFRMKDSDKPLLVIASGSNRINETQIATHLNDTPLKADADFVREWTGFVIGGVPPVCHKRPIEILIDEDLFKFSVIWAAAGHPKAVFQTTPEELLKMTGGVLKKIK